MATAQELQELMQHISQNLPDRKGIAGMRANESAGVVEFTWHSLRIVVTPRGDVFELKGTSLVITGASMLMQSALLTRESNSKVIEGIVNTLAKVEENLKTNRQTSLSLLGEAKKVLARLAGK